ncbi:hypothetical protein A3D80_04640 [Candidatus Roizmanbacteria bacterium RIFCSPHIGHO2_02_FULL_40_13b]|uniref:Dockerin domain-containing protein n=1 Tax=Candidatus Roizmanbacteria bacterium RIFCSPHIGHO2_01_FULL_39_24 TaxID=1802032 RepID=A0A1F7GEU0_9BACT|nr:MAG: hypothetical protein A2799_01710 [Candidatus Roizmanbacteria bacterium RIFCSPHIGHO2_01_FULL_39_24]OGK27891.1 MAG: hypothetical protein A3D80_04640 [Candidatus Roizmanbacteria bacterium RIFCSPHIGHO2_02_FULL_40_13b]OGK49815.1 MAG: hypothetical protein A3A56_02735 [Candidatus Roizmanbacteria bacterium RIFCSPLOWO2_01_FULL_40_32]OGK57261.1 MAG: hypothetical protein A3H83_02060 [Candidatus Roizmanbacteria bacterium RIFCSPLOWO2_02_FULL_39_8]
MSNKALTISTILLVLILSTIFFWQTTNRFLYPSRAQVTSTTTLTPGVVTQVTIAPTKTTGGLSPVPTTGSNTGNCPLRSQGDFNCNGVIDLVDFNVFRIEYTGQSLTKDSDSNADGKVDLIDFDNWRKNAFLLKSA